MKRLARRTAMGVSGLALAALVAGMAAPADVRADEADAKRLLQAMSDYLEAQKSFSFAFDVDYEVVTANQQKIALASSGSMALVRPDKLRVMRKGGFADIEMTFDGKTMTVLGKVANVYTQIEAPGTIDQLVDLMRDKYGRPLPGADLLMSDVYEELMRDVVDVKDLGSGVIGGTECDHLAFRTDAVDWQIWIAQGSSPHPCRYVITSKHVAGAPQYSVRIRDWKAGDAAASGGFAFDNSTGAKQIALEELKEAKDLPEHFSVGGVE